MIRNWTRTFKSGRYVLNSKNIGTPSKDGPPIVNGLYYGKFTKEEYEEAAKHVRSQIGNLEGDIKGSTNIRANVGKMPQFPSREVTGNTKVENLTDLFTQTVKTTGPMTLSTFMRQCLTHPEFGYYTTRDPLDSKTGDFITSPELSSMFGEMLGIWLFTVWTHQKLPAKIRLIEFGPGRGTLMHDVLKTFNKFVEKSQKSVHIEINMIEASRVLRGEQRKLLCGLLPSVEGLEQEFPEATTKWGNHIKWLDTEMDIEPNEEVANYVLAHEFFDALPIKSFERTKNGWREFLVEHTESVVNAQPKLPGQVSPSESEDDLLETKFHLTLSPKETPSSIIPTLNSRFRDLPVGTRIEVCSEAELYVSKMAQLVNNERGIGGVMIMDYGLVGQVPSNSLRGIYKHKFVSPFIYPGKVDLSIDVDFDNLSELTARHAVPFGPVDQGDWLHSLGIGHRVDQLIKKNEGNPEVQEKLYNVYRRLTDEEAMGKIYKFLCVMPRGSSAPVGFGGEV